MNNWKKVKFNDIVEIIDGDRGKNYPKNNEFFDNEYCLFLNTKNVSGEIFCFDNRMFITKEKDEILRKGKLKRGDYVLTTRGTIGNFAFYSNNIPFENIRINSGMVTLRTKNNIDRKYFGCYLRSQFFKNEILQHVSGSAQPQLPIRDLKICDIILPPFKIQQKIAEVLVAYDNLIENNTKRIKILEETAQAIYKEWFVNFRFPGYEKVKVKNGAPEGWEEKKLGDILTLEYGKALTKNNRKHGKIPVYGSSGVIGYHNNYKVEGPGIVVGRAGNAGMVHWVNENFFPVDSSFYVLPTQEINLYFIYYLLKELKLEKLIASAAVPGINRNAVYLENFLLPAENILAEFEKLIKPMFELKFKIQIINNNLRKTRDLLLPKSMSGEIEIN